MRPDIQLTVEDYLSFPPNGMQIQLADGEIIMAPAPNSRHQIVLQNLFFILETFLRRTKAGKLFLAPFDIYLSETTVLQPDISFFAADVLSRISKRGAEGPPTLAIEVLSPTTSAFDQTSKKDLYARFGVREMWIVDTEKSSIEIHSLDSSPTAVLGVGDQLTSKILPGFQTQVEEVFA